MSTYNAVTWLLDRNVDEGRGAKLAFTDTVSELTYGELQRQSRRAANLLRRIGVLAVLIRLDRHAEGRAASAFQSRRHRGNLRQAGARDSRGRCRTVGGKAVFRLRPR